MDARSALPETDPDDPVVRGERGTRQTRSENFWKVGKEGDGFVTMTNFLHLCEVPAFNAHRYHVYFNPKPDSTLLKKIIFDCQKEVIGIPTLFDGEVLYATRPIPMGKRRLISIREREDEQIEHKITIVSTGQILPINTTYLPMLSLLVRKALSLIEMEEIGHHYYDRSQSIRFEEQKVELWPGVITAVRNHDAGMLVCLKPTYKMLRMTSILHILDTLKRQCSSSNEYEAVAKKELIGTIVMAHYNRRTYCIDDIDFTVTPSSKFRLRDGSVTTFKDYYLKRYNVEIIDNSQPMLLSYPKKKDQNKGIAGNIYLIPALCNPTGLTDAMRKDHKFMTKLNDHLHMGPNQMKKMANDFIKKLKESPAVQEEFAKWKLNFVVDFVAADARRLPSEDVFFGPEGSPTPVKVDGSRDWTFALKEPGRGMLFPVGFSHWILFAPRQDFSCVANLVNQLQIAGRCIGLNVAPPVKIVEYKCENELPGVLTVELNEAQSSQSIDFAFIVLLNNSKKTYSDVKKICTLDFQIASQCMLGKNMNKTDAKGKQKLGSICTNLLIQMNAKTGGIPWGVKIPANGIMVLGFDTCKSLEKKGQSVGALVSTRNEILSQYYSRVSFHADRKGLAKNLQIGIQESLDAYWISNGTLPTRMIMYRNGVGEGQINDVLDYEIPRLKQGIEEYYSKSGVPAAELTVITVSKRINSRVLLAKSGIPVRYENVPPGTVVDNVITLPHRYDYFLVAHIANRGTARLTNYNVIYDEIKWAPDKIQRLSYKLCHMSFTGCGVSRIPSPSEYAKKLAYLSGVTLNHEAPDELADVLWFL